MPIAAVGARQLPCDTTIGANLRHLLLSHPMFHAAVQFLLAVLATVLVAAASWFCIQVLSCIWALRYLSIFHACKGIVDLLRPKLLLLCNKIGCSSMLWMLFSVLGEKCKTQVHLLFEQLLNYSSCSGPVLTTQLPGKCNNWGCVASVLCSFMYCFVHEFPLVNLLM